MGLAPAQLDSPFIQYLHFQPLPTSGPCIGSFLCLEWSIPRSSHGWPPSFKDLTHCHPLWWFIQTFQLLLVFGWMYFFGFKSQIYYLLVYLLMYLAVYTWATNLLNLSVCLQVWIDGFAFTLHYSKKDLRQPSLFILFRCFPFVIPWYFPFCLLSCPNLILGTI